MGLPVHTSPRSQKSLDVALSVIGTPVVTLELKNPLSGQTVAYAIHQYPPRVRIDVTSPSEVLREDGASLLSRDLARGVSPRRRPASLVVRCLPQQVAHRHQRPGVVERRHLPSQLQGWRPVRRQQERPAALEQIGGRGIVAVQ